MDVAPSPPFTLSKPQEVYPISYSSTLLLHHSSNLVQQPNIENSLSSMAIAMALQNYTINPKFFMKLDDIIITSYRERN